MPLKKEAFAEYQRERRAAARPCMVCGEVGYATQRYTAAPDAAVIRCCEPCRVRLSGEGQAQPPASDTALASAGEAVAEAQIYRDLLSELTASLALAFAPADVDMDAEALTARVASRAQIYRVAGYPAEMAEGKAFADVTAEYTAAHTLIETPPPSPAARPGRGRRALDWFRRWWPRPAR